jgi:hypothetical protein
MAKGQQRSNREAKKPKKKPAAAPVSISPVKGISDSLAHPKKKT